uniref:Uncharacterized protein n=1 Tax=Pipistrellus kuhlii TaxID=59472 RepID=A0A7J8B1X0_PIPKU|nr:hypothetical protein mPipKuh1_007670 [Pipistrellus kuhlii]
MHFPEECPWAPPAPHRGPYPRKGLNPCPGLELPCPSLSLVRLSCCRLLPPCSPWGQKPKVPGPQHPPEGSPWFSLTSWLSLASARQCSCAPACTPVVSHPLWRCFVRQHPRGACSPWRAAWTFGAGEQGLLLRVRGTAAQSASEGPLLPVRPGSALVSPPWWDSALFCFLLFLFSTKACATRCP